MTEQKLLEAARQTLQDTTAEFDEVEDLISKCDVRNNDEVAQTVDWIQEIKSKKEELEATEKGFVDPLKKVIKELGQLFKPAAKTFDKLEGMLKGKISAFYISQEELEAQLLEEASTVTDKDDKKLLIQAAHACQPVKIEGLIRKNKVDYEYDEPKLMEWVVSMAEETKNYDLLSINKTALKKFITDNEGTDIPGVTKVCTPQIAISKKKD